MEPIMHDWPRERTRRSLAEYVHANHRWCMAYCLALVDWQFQNPGTGDSWPEVATRFDAAGSPGYDKLSTAVNLIHAFNRA